MGPDRARISTDGWVRWTETCYCATPLAHKRVTVLKHYFTSIKTEPVYTHTDSEGMGLKELLAAS